MELTLMQLVGSSLFVSGGVHVIWAQGRRPTGGIRAWVIERLWGCKVGAQPGSNRLARWSGDAIRAEGDAWDCGFCFGIQLMLVVFGWLWWPGTVSVDWVWSVAVWSVAVNVVAVSLDYLAHRWQVQKLIDELDPNPEGSS